MEAHVSLVTNNNRLK